MSKIKITSIPTTKELKLINNNKFTFENKEGKIEVVDYSIVNDKVEEFFRKPLILRDREMEEFERFWDRYADRYVQVRPNSNVLWSQFQTSIKNQEDRNTCSGFAMIAAIEARYKRDYNLDLDLSEQFFWHCFKSTDLHYPTERTYENQISIHGGGNPHEIVRSAINLSLPLEENCPYLGKQEMIAIRNLIPEAGMLEWKGTNMATQEEVDAFEYSTSYISNEARQNAYYGLESYLVLKESFVRNILKMEKKIALGYEIIVSIRLKWKMNAISGVYEYNKNEDKGSHVFLVVGYDSNKKVFIVKNSWNEQGFIQVSYEVAKNCFGLGSIVTAVKKPKSRGKERFIGKWNMNHDGWKGTLIIRRPTNEHNNITRLGHYYAESGKVHAVNGTYSRDGKEMEFYLTNEENTDPTSRNGQKFLITIYSNDITQAAGYTKWHNKPYGVYLSRNFIESDLERNFKIEKWKGLWDMNHDGWKGELELEKLIHFSSDATIVKGTYSQEGKESIPLLGTIYDSSQHILHLSIKFSDTNNQSFSLHFHTLTKDMASGYAFWHGKRYGAVAFKR